MESLIYYQFLHSSASKSIFVPILSVSWYLTCLLYTSRAYVLYRYPVSGSSGCLWFISIPLVHGLFLYVYYIDDEMLFKACTNYRAN